MTTIPSEDAKSRLDELIIAVSEGEEIVIRAKDGHAVRLVGVEPDSNGSDDNNSYGVFKGKIWMSDDFDEPLEDMKDYM